MESCVRSSFSCNHETNLEKFPRTWRIIPGLVKGSTIWTQRGYLQVAPGLPDTGDMQKKTCSMQTVLYIRENMRSTYTNKPQKFHLPEGFESRANGNPSRILPSGLKVETTSTTLGIMMTRPRVTKVDGFSTVGGWTNLFEKYYIHMYMNINLTTWNPNDPCFDWKRPCFGGFNHQNRGQTGSRYINIYIYYILYIFI